MILCFEAHLTSNLRQCIRRIITVYVKRMESFTPRHLHFFSSGMTLFIRRKNISLYAIQHLLFLEVYTLLLYMNIISFVHGRHPSLRPFRVTAESAELTATPICLESRSTRFSSSYCLKCYVLTRNTDNLKKALFIARLGFVSSANRRK